MKALRTFAAAMLLLSAGLPVAASGQTTTTFDFNTDPTGILEIIESFEIDPAVPETWRPTGGVDNSGYLAITDAETGQRRTIIFEDFNDGAVVSAFTFSCDLRTGGGTSSPADGYSVSFARNSDPVLTGGAFAGINAETNLPEEGTQTGISIGLDEWGSGGIDVIGISVRVDNVLVNQTAMPTLNGGPEDTTSLQTGPSGVFVDPVTFELPDHSFVNLTIHMDEDGTLDVIYKGRAILDNFPTSYFPSPGRIVFAGRTGGSTSHHHVDNIVITTTSATEPIVSQLVLAPTDFLLEITDSATSAIDPAKPLTITMDGEPLTVVRNKAGAVTTLTALPAAGTLYPPGQHDFVINATDTNNNPITLTPVATTVPYTPLEAAWAATAGQVNTAQAGFRVLVHQVDFTRYPGDANILPLPEKQFFGGFYDLGANAFPEEVSAAGTEPDGAWIVPDFIDWDEVAAPIGQFQGTETEIPGIPGETGSTDNIAAQVFAWLDLPAGVTKLGVTSDDGFTVSVGSNPLDFFQRVQAGEFNGGRGAAETTFDIATTTAGLYPVRLLWWEGGGGANLEFYSVLPDNTRVLLNDIGFPDHIKAYYGGVPATPAIHRLAPYPGTAANDSRQPLVIELTDGVATVTDASIALKINGADVTPVVGGTGAITTVTYLPASGLWPLSASGNVDVELTFQDSASNSRTESWSFGVLQTETLTLADGIPASSVSNPGYTVRPYQVEVRTGISGELLANYNETGEGLLAGLFGPNIANLAGATNGVFAINDVLNWDQDLSGIGNFFDDVAIPGSVDPVDNIAAEVLAWLVFPEPGFYIMGVNSDDNFRITLGHDGPTRQLLQLSGSASINGPQPAIDGSRQFGSIAAPLTGVVEADVVIADPLDGSTELTNAAAAAGKIVYIDRGVADFATKIRNAEAAGAVGVIIGNNTEGYPIVMGGDGAGINIPAVMTSQAAGTAIKAAVGGGDPLRASFGYDATRRIGEFQGGRGAADSIFLINVQDAGAYPFRLTWQEGGGGANCEWFTVLPDGTRILVNDLSNASSIRAFQSGEPLEVILVTEFSVDRPAGDFSLSWQSAPGANYRIDSSPDLQTWSVVSASVPAAAGATTTFEGNSAAVTTDPRFFLRVSRLPD